MKNIEDHATENVDSGPGKDAKGKISLHYELVGGRVEEKIDSEK